MKKVLSCLACLSLLLSLSTIAFASDRYDMDAESFKLDTGEEIVHVNDNVLDFNIRDEIKTDEFNSGLITNLKQTNYSPKIDDNGNLTSNKELINTIRKYCNANYDPMESVRKTL